MTRLLSGIVMGAAVLAAILFLPSTMLRVLAAVVAVLAGREFLRIADAPPSLPVLALIAVAAWLVPEWRGDLALRFVVLIVVWAGVTVLWLGTTIQQAGVQALAPLYVGLPLGMLASVHAVAGPGMALVLIGTVVVSDSAQYYTGRAFGRRPLAPAISPKKTIEGAVGGVVFGTVFLVAAGRLFLRGTSLPLLVGLGVVMVVAGICGDLFESRLKRASGVKDSSSIIPGHGGVLDRIDALLFVVPVFYLYLQTVRP
jgi:phosphatidate cytidylyltransferase